MALWTISVSSGVAWAGPSAKDKDKYAHRTKQEKLEPARVYDGSTPVDLENGMLGNNGTFGVPNPDYEALAKSDLTAPGLFAAPYTYEQKKNFLSAIQGRLRFYEEAIVNLKERSASTKPEAVQFSDALLSRLENLLSQTRDAMKQAKSAGKNEWPAAEQAARSAFIALQSTYLSITSQN